MPRSVTLRWDGDPNTYGDRRSRTGYDYQAFIPDPIRDAQLSLPGETALLVSGAESEIRAINRGATSGGLEAVGALLLRAESVASSRIEGLEDLAAQPGAGALRPGGCARHGARRRR